MDEKTAVNFLVLLMLSTTSSLTINPSSTIISDSINPSSTSSSNINPSSTSSSNINPSSTSSSISNPSTTSSFTVKPASTTSSFTVKPSSSANYGFISPKPSSSYEVTENVIDIPDDRTSPPIVTNFGLFKPLNVVNTTISHNKVTKNDTSDEDNEVKRTSFTYVHFNQDTEKKKEKEQGGIGKFFRGISDYVINLKKGVVDGWQRYFYKDNRKKDKDETFYDKFHRSNGDFSKNDDEIDFHHNFHRSYQSDEKLDDYEYDEFEREVKDLND